MASNLLAMASNMEYANVSTNIGVQGIEAGRWYIFCSEQCGAPAGVVWHVQSFVAAVR